MPTTANGVCTSKRNGTTHARAICPQAHATWVDKAVEALKGGELMNVIEYQRAVHAEARAIDVAPGC